MTGGKQMDGLQEQSCNRYSGQDDCKVCRVVTLSEAKGLS